MIVLYKRFLSEKCSHRANGCSGNHLSYYF